ncbi:hypothetical protein ROJ8625_03402 [Roseivivax jejudonensis]|uniref:Uncharacterized protein n=1 Tax=Roseivivax jejudonensis TaxID=1529041 RepID=A0A1X7A2I8_9RHOB|nr:hypothetical protein ROJ8625_03402 [Roseivivax jejudonensis]
MTARRDMRDVPAARALRLRERGASPSRSPGFAGKMKGGPGA